MYNTYKFSNKCNTTMREALSWFGSNVWISLYGNDNAYIDGEMNYYILNKYIEETVIGWDEISDSSVNIYIKQ